MSGQRTRCDLWAQGLTPDVGGRGGRHVRLGGLVFVMRPTLIHEEGRTGRCPRILTDERR